MTDLIKPVTTWSQWLQDPGAAGQAIDAWSADAWVQTGFWGVAAVLALKVASFIPGWGPMVSGLGEAALGWIMPKQVKQAKQQAEVVEQAAYGIMEAIESSPHASSPAIKDLKQRIYELTPAEFETVFCKWKESRKKPAKIEKP